LGQDKRRFEVHDRDDGGRLRAIAYTRGDAIPAGWLGGEPVAVGLLCAGTEFS
jgi:hypothetical protein